MIANIFKDHKVEEVELEIIKKVDTKHNIGVRWMMDFMYVIFEHKWTKAETILTKT